MNETPQLTLVSSSTARAAQLTEAGFEFDQTDPLYDDPPEPAQGTRAGQQARMLAGVKALSRYDLVAADRILLSADTIVTSVDGENIGKPSSRRHAHQILDVLIGHPHHVVTGVAVLAADEMRLSHESAEIFITRPSRDSFEQYLDSEAWRGAAGAYRLDDLRGRGWTVSTSLEPVGGLPIALLSEILGSFGVAAKHGGT